MSVFGSLLSKNFKTNALSDLFYTSGTFESVKRDKSISVDFPKPKLAYPHKFKASISDSLLSDMSKDMTVNFLKRFRLQHLTSTN